MRDRALHHWFAASVADHPDRIALEVGGDEFTYRELDAVSARMAERVLDWVGAVPPRVGLLAARSLTAYAGYLAAQRIGSTVVPLNPSFPATRNDAITAAAEVRLVITDGPAPDGIASIAFSADDVRAMRAAGAPPRAVFDLHPENHAYILFTSGSTGTPKGVPVRHTNVSAYLSHVIPRYQLAPGARLSQNFDLTFDLSVFDLYAAWGSGATLVVPGPRDLMSPTSYVDRNGLTHWLSVPSLVSFAARRRSLRPDAMPSLRWSLFCGEPLTPRQARAWRTAASSSVVENLYGPTELTVSCLEHRLPADVADWPSTMSGTVPIGVPYPGLDHIVVDETGMPAEIGELCVRGAQRFDGYLDPAHDIGSFVRFDGTGPATAYDGTTPLTGEHWYRTGDRVSSLDGGWVHLGRVDNQVKIRGYRVELGEIEAVLRERHGVEEAIVVVVPDEDGDPCLEGAVVGGTGEPGELVDALRERLPEYMVPRRITRFDEFPLNLNGKIDRRALAERFSSGPGVDVGSTRSTHRYD